MWLMAVSILLLPAVVMISRHCRLKMLTLCHRAQAWALWILREEVCVRRAHAFVFSKCTHGKIDSVLETYDLYNKMYPSLSIGSEIGAALDEVVRRVQPSMVLDLGTHCGYSSVRMLRLLPPHGRLITVEMDPQIADLGEEIILVAGFKHHQFEVLISSSAEAIPSLYGFLGSHQEGFSLVLMDHDQQQYLKDLQALETEGLLRLSGCSIILIYRDRKASNSVSDIWDYFQTKEHCYCIKSNTLYMMEVCYQNTGTTVQGKS